MKKCTVIVTGIYCLASLVPLLLSTGCANNPSDPAAPSEPVGSSEAASAETPQDTAPATEAFSEPQTDPEPIGAPVDWRKMQ